jgi:hypothetical protein
MYALLINATPILATLVEDDGDSDLASLKSLHLECLESLESPHFENPYTPQKELRDSLEVVFKGLEDHYAFTPEQLQTLSTSDTDLQCNAYAAAIHLNDVNALQKFEQAHIPVPNKDNLTFMMRQYALPCKAEVPFNAERTNPYEPKVMYLQYTPQQPKKQALLWCLDHGADPNGEYSPISYKPFIALPESLRGAPHPLEHVAAYSNASERLELLRLLKDKHAYLAYYPEHECKQLIRYVLGRSIIHRATKEVLSDNMQRISDILSIYKGTVIDTESTQDIKHLIRKSREVVEEPSTFRYRIPLFYYDHPLENQARELKEQLKPYDEMEIAKQECKHQIAAFLKSLFSCGKAAEQVIPLSNQ